MRDIEEGLSRQLAENEARGQSAIEVVNLSKTVADASGELTILHHVDFTVQPAETLAIVGASGSGKSTLLGLLAGLDSPSTGKVLLNGQDIFALDEDGRAALRKAELGFVFQSYHLLPRTTATENVQLPLLYADRRDYRERSEAALEAVGLADRRNHLAEELSGGQQQRVAIARAIVNEPSVLLADEPTGNLDSAATREIVELLAKLNANGTTVVVITHDPEVAKETPRVVRIRDGRVESDDRARGVA